MLNSVWLYFRVHSSTSYPSSSYSSSSSLSLASAFAPCCRSNYARPSYCFTHASSSAVDWSLLLALILASWYRRSIFTKICILPCKSRSKWSIDFVLLLYSTRICSSLILQALHITCKAFTVHYPCTWLPTAELTLWHKTKCSGACQQPDTKPTQPASTPELDHEEANRT